MECPFEPPVERAFEEAKRLAKVKRRQALEITHLFYGMLAAKGGVAERILRDEGMDVEYLTRCLFDMVKELGFQNEAIPTRNFQDCRRMALDIAWHEGSPSVREQDLLWAILLKANDSKTFVKASRVLGIDIQGLKKALERVHPRPENLLSPVSASSGVLE